MADDVTRMLSDWRAGDTAARDRLIAVLYPELRRLAEQIFRKERSGHTLQPTALVSEAWLRLSGGGPIAAEDRHRLFAAVAHLMREILIDHARRRDRHKRSGGERVTLSGLEIAVADVDIDIEDLDEWLTRLEQIDPGKARVVELRYFGGLSIEETAQALDQSTATVKRRWHAARLWLYHGLTSAGAASS